MMQGSAVIVAAAVSPQLGTGTPDLQAVGSRGYRERVRNLYRLAGDAWPLATREAQASRKRAVRRPFGGPRLADQANDGTKNLFRGFERPLIG